MMDAHQGLQLSRQAKADANLPPKRTCGTMDLHRTLLEQSEEYRRERSKIESNNNK